MSLLTIVEDCCTFTDSRYSYIKDILTKFV